MPKLTIPSPSMVHYRGGRASIDESLYPELDAFWADLTTAYADEVRRLGELGCTYLQFDDTSLAYLNDPTQREYIATLGGDPDKQHVEYIRHINEALAHRPDGMAVTTHMCRGNFQSSWVAEGGYDFVAEALFNELEVDGFFMEWDDERSGGFEPLRFVPKGKTVVLGLVTTKHGELEAKDELKRRIDEASQFVDVDQLCLSPQCGFSSTVEGNALSYDDEVAKLRLVVETAEEVWGCGDLGPAQSPSSASCATCCGRWRASGSRRARRRSTRAASFRGTSSSCTARTTCSRCSTRSSSAEREPARCSRSSRSRRSRRSARRAR